MAEPRIGVVGATGAVGQVTLALLAELPANHPVLLFASLSFITYYLVASFILHARAALKLRRYRSGGAGQH